MLREKSNCLRLYSSAVAPQVPRGLVTNSCGDAPRQSIRHNGLGGRPVTICKMDIRIHYSTWLGRSPSNPPERL